MEVLESLGSMLERVLYVALRGLLRNRRRNSLRGKGYPGDEGGQYILCGQCHEGNTGRGRGQIGEQV